MYGLLKTAPFREDMALTATISPYAATKLAAEQLCSNYAHLYGMRTINLRFFTVYGPRCEVFNLGESQTTTLRDLISSIESALGKKAAIEQLPEQPGDVPLTFADISKARAQLGYDPHTQIAEGIPKFVEWFHATRRG